MIEKKTTEVQMTLAARLADPTNEPRGFIRTKPKTRHLRRNVQHEYKGNHTKALTPCEVIAVDGSRHRFTKTRDGIKRTTITPSETVTVHRRRAPKYDLGTILMRADTLGLDVLAVRDEYRHRTDNGYSRTISINIESNATFRGGDN